MPAPAFEYIDTVNTSGACHRRKYRTFTRSPQPHLYRLTAAHAAVATIRPLVGIFYATSRLSGLTPHEFFGVAFWLGFVLHLIVAETWINLTRPSVILAKNETLA